MSCVLFLFLLRLVRGKLPEFFDGKFSDAGMASLVVRHRNFLSDGKFRCFFCFIFHFGWNFSSKKCQGHTSSCHTCGTYSLGKYIYAYVLFSTKVTINIYNGTTWIIELIKIVNIQRNKAVNMAVQVSKAGQSLQLTSLRHPNLLAIFPW